MTSQEESSTLPLTWLCLALLVLVPLGLRVLYAVRLTQRQCQSEPLERAILQNDLPALRVRLDHGTSPNTRLELPSIASVSPAAVWKNVLHGDVGPTTPLLSLAVQVEKAPLVQLLLERGANPNLRDSNGATPLMRFPGNYNHYYDTGTTNGPREGQIVGLLIAHGAQIDTHDRQHNTALFYAVQCRNLQVAKALLERGAATNIRNLDGQTPLSITIEAGEQSEKIVRLLLDHGADPNAPLAYGATPMSRACELISTNVVAALLAHGGDPNVHSPSNDMTPLMQALRLNNQRIFGMALAKGADVNAFSKYNSSVLFMAVQYHRLNMAKVLLEHGANPNFINQYELRDPPLILAAAANDSAMVALLLAHGADVNLAGKDDGRTPLIASIGADLWDDYADRHKNASGTRTIDPGDALKLTASRHPDNLGVAPMLLAHGAQVSARDWSGNTPLSLAALGHKTPLVRLLLARGAYPSVGVKGELLATVIAKRGYSDIAVLLTAPPPQNKSQHSKTPYSAQ